MRKVGPRLFVAIHEAAHAVITHARGILFIDTSVTNPAELQNVLTGASAIAGGLRLTIADHSSWVPQRAEDALDMLLATAIAERLTFGHILPQSLAVICAYFTKAWAGSTANILTPATR